MLKKDMKIAIIGAGGVGGYFGAKLAHSGFDVTFLARGKHLDAIRSSGLTVKSFLGDFQTSSLSATDKISDIAAPDLIILGVKAWQIKEIREDLRKIINPNSVILPLQNGVSAARELSEVIDRSNIIGGLCRIMSRIESPGVIVHSGIKPTIIFGELDKTESERCRKIKAVFDEAGIKARLSTDIESEIWKKFIPICVSGLLAVTRTTYGELRELKETRDMMFELLNEVYSISQKAGINIKADFISKTMSFMDTFPYDATASLTRDVWAGKPSEIEHQNGTVVRLGKELDVRTPVNSFIYKCILPMELKARGHHEQ